MKDQLVLAVIGVVLLVLGLLRVGDDPLAGTVLLLVSVSTLLPAVLRYIGVRRSSVRLVVTGLAVKVLFFGTALLVLIVAAVTRGEASWAIPLIGGSIAVGSVIAWLAIRRLKRKTP